MSFMLGTDNLKPHRLAGGNIISHAPLFASTGDSIFLISDRTVHVYSTTTGLHVRELDGAAQKLVGMELELRNEDILVSCTERGELLRWKWSTGQVKSKIQLKIPENCCVTSFNQLDWYGDSETANILVLYKNRSGCMKWQIFETHKGENVIVPCSLGLNENPAIAAVNTGAFKIICLAQSSRIYFIDYTTWKWIGLTNGLKIPITCLKWHPAEQMIATGDELGRILLWREFWDKTTVKNRLYHWHSTPVTSVAFTQSGSGFYSSGMEAVLVIWNVDRPEIRKFVPHITCVVRHIAVSNANIQVAISTLDNGVQILGNDNSVKCNLQEFTYNLEDGTGRNRFPVGLRMNPRSNALVLNGRIGHLQFYAAHTRSLLYNMDIVSQNQLTMEQGKILYNIHVTKAAFNIDWMATGEVYNDEEHFPELRLKFWKYLEESQSYALNTSIELPHEGGFRAIEFSSSHQVENLLCASVGEDNTIKIWGLEETDNIYKKGKVWFCIAQTNYKQLPIESVSFSQDGSLLAAGCGNTLCVFKADSLKLKATLNTSPCIDGSISKAEVRLAGNESSSKSESHSKEHKNILQQFSNALENIDDVLVKKLKGKNQPHKSEILKSSKKVTSQEIGKEKKAKLFQNIMHTHHLNLFQQLILFQRLGIKCEVTPSWHGKMLTYLRETVHKTSLTERVHDLNARVRRLNVKHRFKAKYRLHQFLKHKQRATESEITEKLVSILSVLGLQDKPMDMNGKIHKDEQMDIDDEKEISCKKLKDTVETVTEEDSLKLSTTANISHVQFAANEYGHLIIVCTETRVLIWNLLTLRLENILKLSTKHLAFDPLTNLAAVFTKSNEVHIFQPNVPMPIYQRDNLPTVLGATWLPRRFPKRSSIHVDWQAQSILYFFTDCQEILYLNDPNSQDHVDLPLVAFKNPTETVGLQYSTFGTFATQQISDKPSNTSRSSGPLIVGNAGKTAVKVLVDMSTHTMPPISLVCHDFMKSLVKPVESTTTSPFSKPSSSATGDKKKSHNRNINGGINGSYNGLTHDSSEDELDVTDNGDEVADDGDVPMMNGVESAKTQSLSVKMSAEAYRKNIVAKVEEIKVIHEKLKTKEQSERLNTETHLRKIAALSLDLEF